MLLRAVAAILVLFSVIWSVQYCAAAPDYSVFKSRPRLYFNKSRLAELRSLKDEKPYSDFLRIIRKGGRALVGNRAPANLLLSVIIVFWVKPVSGLVYKNVSNWTYIFCLVFMVLIVSCWLRSCLLLTCCLILII